MDLKPIVLPDNFSYIGVFLTFSCQLRCGYCINHHGGDLFKGRTMSLDNWVTGLNRIITTADLPITLQGGEPTVHRYFFEIVDGIDRRLPIDLLTNLEMDIEKFCQRIPPDRMRRNASYTSIRVSYHHGQSDFEELTRKVLALQQRGYSIGISEVGHPEYMHDVIRRREQATATGIDYRIKEFLGPWNNRTYGAMRYPDAVNGSVLRSCECRTSEFLIAPDGHLFRCHSDLYAGREAIGHLLDEEPPKLGVWRPCSVYGKCNSCDIKMKTTNLFTKNGGSGVEIRNISEPHACNTQIGTVVNTYGKV